MSTLLEGLNPEQLKAVTEKSGPLLIVAGAGTGKTTVITRRIAYLITQKLAKPEQILALTFTEKAAEEMEERVDQLIPLGYTDYWISTFHSFCQRILEQHGLDIGLPNDFKLLDDTAQWILIHNNFEKFNLDYYKPLGNPNKFIDSLLDHFSKCKDELITPEDYLQYAENLKLSSGSTDIIDEERAMEIKRITELANSYHVYQKLLLDNEALDFGDLINYTILLFKKRPNILKYYQEKFAHLLVDEFQDTNFAQYELIKLLSGNNKNLVVVGDDDQSIYKFRGASVSNILKLKTDFPKVKELTLIQNYRSRQEILDLAYNFIQNNNPDRLEAQLKIKKKLTGHNQNPGQITVLEGTDLNSETNLVIKTILELKQKNTKVTWNDFAILLRANSAANEILPKLDQSGIPYTFLANKGLYLKPLISDILSYCKLLDNYHDSKSLYRVLNLPKFRIDAEDLATITYFEAKKAWSLYSCFKNIDLIPEITLGTKHNIQKLVGFINEHSKQITEKSAAEMLIIIINDLGIVEQLLEDTQVNSEHRDLLDQFYKKIEKFEEEHDNKTLKNFLYELELEKQAGHYGSIKFDPNNGPESLKIMTIHSSKGLEFQNVFIMNMVDQRFPTRAKKDSIAIPDELIKDILPSGDAHLQEERRLFYVAITRAKENLFFSWAKDYGGSKTKQPSLFLQETNLVPSEKVNKATGKVVLTKPALTKNKTVFKRLPVKFSFSDFSTFENCPLEYKYRYYLKLPLPGAPALSFGKSIHNTLQKYLTDYSQAQNHTQNDLFKGSTKPKVLPNFEQIKHWYEKEWIDEWYKNEKQKTEYKKLGLEMLGYVQVDTENLNPNVKFIEQEFKLKFEDFSVVGRIDRADITTDNKLDIIDYKTGQAPKSKSKKDVDQLRLYQLAAKEVFDLETNQLIYWYLKGNQKVEIKPATDEELQSLKEKIVQNIELIRETIKYDKFLELHKKASQHDCKYLDLI